MAKKLIVLLFALLLVAPVTLQASPPPPPNSSSTPRPAYNPCVRVRITTDNYKLPDTNRCFMIYSNSNNASQRTVILPDNGRYLSIYTRSGKIEIKKTSTQNLKSTYIGNRGSLILRKSGSQWLELARR